MSRQGKHREDKYRVQAYYEAQEKALFVLVARLDGTTLTDLIKTAISDRAKMLGVLGPDGKVTALFKDALAIETSIIQQAENNKKGNKQ